MKYLNFDVLESIDAAKYRTQLPFPYIDFHGPLYEDAYQALVTAPDVSLFEKQFGIERSHGQKFHDRYFLAYTQSLPIAKPWKEFIEELSSDRYRSFLERLFNIKRGTYNFVFSWNYMPRDTCITPHCDTYRKIGSQLFYLNTSDTWNTEWGGQTLALNDDGKRSPYTGPALSEFDKIFTSKSVDNNSFIFTRTDHSWHAVDTIQCPDGLLRKMFSVVANRKQTFREKMMSRFKSVLKKTHLAHALPKAEM